MQLVVEPDGSVRCVYGEELDLLALGHLEIKRGSYVEPTDNGLWQADLGPVEGPLLGPFRHRSQALVAEREWLDQHWVGGQAFQVPTDETKP